MSNKELQDTEAWESHWERNFRRQLLKLREERQYTQSDLARLLRESFGLRFHQQTIQRIESGERPVRLNEAHLIARALQVELDSMTADIAQPDYQSLLLEVDRIRATAHVTAMGQMRKMDALVAGTVAGFANLLAERIAGAPPAGTPEFHENGLVVAWGVHWAKKIIFAYDAVHEATEALYAMAYGDDKPDHFNEAGLQRTSLSVLKSLKGIVRNFEDMGISLDAAVTTNPNDLYARFSWARPATEVEPPEMEET